jgi:hypothetical protein
MGPGFFGFSFSRRVFAARFRGGDRGAGFFCARMGSPPSLLDAPAFEVASDRAIDARGEIDARLCVSD